MKKNKIHNLIFFLFLGFSIGVFGQTSYSQNLKIMVSNIKSVEGNIMIAIFNSDQKFLGNEMVTGKIEPVTQTGIMTITVEGLPLGEYAISIYHDGNANETLDTNLFKLPAEPYGFSNDARGTFGPPSFEDAKIIFNSNQQNTKISLK